MKTRSSSPLLKMAYYSPPHPPAYLDLTRKDPPKKTLVKLNSTIASALKLFLWFNVDEISQIFTSVILI